MAGATIVNGPSGGAERFDANQLGIPAWPLGFHPSIQGAQAAANNSCMSRIQKGWILNPTLFVRAEWPRSAVYTLSMHNRFHVIRINQQSGGRADAGKCFDFPRLLPEIDAGIEISCEVPAARRPMVSTASFPCTVMPPSVPPRETLSGSRSRTWARLREKGEWLFTISCAAPVTRIFKTAIGSYAREEP